MGIQFKLKIVLTLLSKLQIKLKLNSINNKNNEDLKKTHSSDVTLLIRSTTSFLFSVSFFPAHLFFLYPSSLYLSTLIIILP
jgi:hypothetical protein